MYKKLSWFDWFWLLIVTWIDFFQSYHQRQTDLARTAKLGEREEGDEVL